MRRGLWSLGLCLLVACATPPPVEPVVEVPKEEEPACRVDGDCGRRICQAGQCVACTEDAVCGEGRRCVAGECTTCRSFDPIEMVASGLGVVHGEARAVLDHHAACVTPSNPEAPSGGRLVIECASDGKGLEEEQVALARRRGDWVLSELVGRGAALDRLMLAPTDRWLPAGDDRCRFKWEE